MHQVRCVPPGNEPYRYILDVTLRDDPTPKLAVVMKNPSTASDERSDATIGKVEAWARRHGFGTITCVNLFALRATDASQLNRHPYTTLVGPNNDRHILEAAAAADLLVAAWGNPNGIAPNLYDRRIAEVLHLLAGYPLHAVGPLTRDGYPRHGRLWNSACELGAWHPAPGSSAPPIANLPYNDCH